MTSVSADSTKTRLHFSDGILEIDEDSKTQQTEVEGKKYVDVDPKLLSWGPWTKHMTHLAGNKTLQVFDYLGEGLASFLGITTPKYQFEINEYHRMKLAEEAAQRERDEEMGSWATDKQTQQITDSPPRF